MATWIEALKQWNARKGGRYTVPKKGTKDYDEVKALMGKKGKGKPKKESDSDSDGEGSYARSRAEMEEMVGGALFKALVAEAKGGSHKSQYIRWLLGRVRGDREGQVYSHKSEDWDSQDNVYKRPFMKDSKRKPDTKNPPTETPFAGWRPEDWKGKHPPFTINEVEKKSKFIQRMKDSAKPKFKIPKADIERAREEPDETFEETKEKKKYKLNPNLRKFPGITSKQMVDFRTRVGSRRSQNTFGELTNMGKFFGDDDFLNKFDTAVKLEPFVKAWERVKDSEDPKDWYKANYGK